MSNEAVEYVYLNVGFADNESPDAVEYVYFNVGSFGIATTLGRVVGIANKDRHAVEYVYKNVTE